MNTTSQYEREDIEKKIKNDSWILSKCIKLTES